MTLHEEFQIAAGLDGKENILAQGAKAQREPLEIRQRFAPLRERSSPHSVLSVQGRKKEEVSTSFAVLHRVDGLRGCRRVVNRSRIVEVTARASCHSQNKYD